MAWVAAAVLGGNTIGALIGGNAAQNAAQMQSDAANKASALQWAEYQQNRTDQAPWREAGASAINNINNNMGDYSKTFTLNDFNQDPGYQFRLQQGQQALERSAAARGGLNSGATLKSLANYSQGVASDEYNNAYNRFNQDRDQKFNKLASIAGIGQTSVNQTGQTGAQTAASIGQNMIGAGNAQAAGTIGTANAINSAIGNGMNTWMNYSLMNKFAPQTPSSSVPSVNTSGLSSLTYNSPYYGNMG